MLPELILMFGVSLLVWKEKSQESFNARPGLTVISMVGILLVIGLHLLGPQ